ncbi:MAG: transcriptional repressor LexA [Deferrisomatales bacterium]
MHTTGLTPKQKQVLDFISESTEARGYAPSQQEIAERFGFRSLGTVQNYLVRLERQGLLRRPWNAKRAVEVVRPDPEAHELPLVGCVAAGRPIEAVETHDALAVPPWMVTGGDSFVLRVKGDSMVGDGILDGDYVVVRRQATAANGQTVVALVEGEATVKRWYARGDRVELRPANPAVESLWVDASRELRIEGVVTGVLRRCP